MSRVEAGPPLETGGVTPAPEPGAAPADCVCESALRPTMPPTRGPAVTAPFATVAPATIAAPTGPAAPAEAVVAPPPVAVAAPITPWPLDPTAAVAAADGAGTGVPEDPLTPP